MVLEAVSKSYVVPKAGSDQGQGKGSSSWGIPEGKGPILNAGQGLDLVC